MNKKNWSAVIWIANLKFLLEIALSIATVFIAFFSWQVYRNQLKVMETEVAPKFKIDISKEPLDDTFERYIKVTNLGEPTNVDIDTKAIMTIQINNGSKENNLNILLDGYFYETDDMIAHGTEMSNVLCKRGTNLCDSYLGGLMVDKKNMLNENFTTEKTQIAHNIFYLVKLSYNNYNDKIVNKYYYVGNFDNMQIDEKSYLQYLKTQYTLNVGDYLNSPVDKELARILVKYME